LVLRVRSSGAVTIGWPAVWAAAVLPYRVLGLSLSPDVAFGFAAAISLLANVVTIAATFLLGLWTTGRREIGLLAAALVSVSPLLVLLLGETRDAGTWGVDLGLYAYSEPLSTALVAAGCALVVRAERDPATAVAAGALLGFAVTVRLSNALVAVVAVAVLLLRRSRTAALYASAAGLAFLPVVIAYWPLGYPDLPPEQFPDDPFALEHATRAWSDSIVWGLRSLVVLVPLALLGALRLPCAWALLLAGWIGATALLYTFYSFTPLHPRFLFVALPAVYVLWSAGAVGIVDRLRTAAEHRG
ncbi:MAG: hypothetical protein ACRDNB_00880, partial [Gaiellaceae bacterium]